MRPTIFLDRDGVIIENRPNYVRDWAEVEFIPGVLDALAALAGSEFAIVIVTNQAGIGKGLIARAVADSINQKIRDAIVQAGGRVDGIYVCPHTDADQCACRKPKPGLLLQAARELSLDLARSWMVGDALTDLQAGQAAGVQTVLVLSGRGSEQKATHRLDGVADLSTALAQIRQT
jgi:D-glycero-D-manno-heptose 1,7-bisphosphate phosphatase